MFKIIRTAKKLDWDGWAEGLIKAFISGGFGAIGAGFGVPITDPAHFQIGNGQLYHLIEAMGVTFLIAATLSLAAYLQTHPLPDEIK